MHERLIAWLFIGLDGWFDCGCLFCFVFDEGWRLFRNVSLFCDSEYLSARRWPLLWWALYCDPVVFYQPCLEQCLKGAQYATYPMASGEPILTCALTNCLSKAVYISIRPSYCMCNGKIFQCHDLSIWSNSYLLASAECVLIWVCHGYDRYSMFFDLELLVTKGANDCRNGDWIHITVF